MAACLSNVSAMFLKSALLVFYLRIFRPNKTARILILVPLVAIISFYATCLIVAVVQCHPNDSVLTFSGDIDLSHVPAGVNIPNIPADFNLSLIPPEVLIDFITDIVIESSFEIQSESKCFRPQLKLSAAQGIFSTVSDFYVLALPIALTLSIQLNLKRKLGLCAVFLTGLL